jgi:hypothetical protein
MYTFAFYIYVHSFLYPDPDSDSNPVLDKYLGMRLGPALVRIRMNGFRLDLELDQFLFCGEGGERGMNEGRRLLLIPRILCLS